MRDAAPDQTTIHSPAPQRRLHRRTDWYSARTVERAVQLQLEAGTQAAAAFLKSNSIVADITIRTLLHPDQRRVGP